MTDNEERLRQAAARMQGKISDRLGEVWVSYLLRGLFALALGVAALFWPGTGAVAISWVIAALALMVGSLLIYLALHLRHVDQDISKLRQ